MKKSIFALSLLILSSIPLTSNASYNKDTTQIVSDVSHLSIMYTKVYGSVNNDYKKFWLVNHKANTSHPIKASRAHFVFNGKHILVNGYTDGVTWTPKTLEQTNRLSNLVSYSRYMSVCYSNACHTLDLKSSSTYRYKKFN